MATSAIAFEASLVLDTATSLGEREFFVSPPSNLAGKLCYGEVKIFNLTWGTEYTTPKAYHTFVLRIDGWMQPQNARIEPLKQTVMSPWATLTYGGDMHSVPVLFNMPLGPHTVRMTVERLDLGSIGTSAVGDVDLIVVLDIVAANSRQIPLNG